MKYISSTVAAFLVAAIIETGPVVAETQIPEGWREIDLQFLDHTTSTCVNWSKAEWQVSLKDNMLQIKPYDYQAKPHLLPASLQKLGVQYATAYMRSKKGWLVATDSGEWGGELTWHSEFGREILQPENTRVLLKQKDAVVAAGGLAHLMMDQGFVLKLKQSRDGSWTRQKYFRMGTSILFAFPAQKNSVYLVGKARTSRFDWDRGIQSEHDNYIFQSSYPNSAVIDEDGAIFIGMRHAVSVLRETHDQWSERWIVRQDCPYLKKVNETECSCSQTKFGELDAPSEANDN